MLIYLYTLLTIVVFALALKISQKWQSMLFNSFVLSVLFLVAILLACQLPYDQYMQGNAPLNNLLAVGVVALAVPLYEQLRQIASDWQIILISTTVASLLAMFSGALLALILGANPQMVATVLPKSVTTPIAMAIADNLHGLPAVAAVGVVLAGIQGSVLGYVVLQKIGLKNQQAIGLAVGAVSHAMGTVSCMEKNLKAGSYSSISLVLCGIISSVLAPFVFKLVYALF